MTHKVFLGGILLLLLIAPAFAADEKRTDVHVILPADIVLPKSPVVIFRAPDDKNDWPMFQTNGARDKQQDVVIPLPPGRYVAEVGGTSDDAIALLRSAPFTVPDTDEVKLVAERHTADGVIGGSPARVRQLALRRCGNGEIRWSADNPKPPVVVTTPGQPYVVSTVAELGNTTMAVWLPGAEIKTPAIHFTDAIATHRMKFAIRPGTPPLVTSRVTLFFPDCHVKIENPADRAVFVSNRDRALVDYEIETAAKEKLAFGWDATMIEKASTFEYGGPLKPRLFAAFIWADNGKWDPGDVFTRLDLVDATGRILDTNRSHCNFHDDKFLAPGDETPKPLDKNKPNWNGFKPETILAKVRYDYGGHEIVAECRGEGMVKIHSEHFSLTTPPQWMFRGKQFLSMMEQVRLITKANTGRRGPDSFKVEWRSNGNNAKSIVANPKGGGKEIWMSFPWWTFDTFWDPFEEPWFGNKDPYVCHETLHTFGYNHGDDMSHLEWRGEDQYRTLRWKAVDSGNWTVWADPVKVDTK